MADPAWLQGKISAWHMGEGGDLTLAAFLGWTDDEYDRFIEQGTLPVDPDRQPRMMSGVICALAGNGQCTLIPKCPSMSTRACAWEELL